jgi:hypothetical protein
VLHLTLLSVAYMHLSCFASKLDVVLTP